MNEATIVVRGLLQERGITVHELAAAVGLGIDRVNDQILGKHHTWRAAWLFERYLGAAIWTPSETFVKYRRCSELLGVDVRLTRFHDLRPLAIKLRVPNARVLTSRAALIKAVLSHYDGRK